MPHVIPRTSRMPQNRYPAGMSADGNIFPSASVIQVIVKTPGNQRNFTVPDDTSVRQLKEKLCAHFKCQMDQLVLVFMGRLLKDHDTLSQRGIVNGHTIHVVIKSKHGSRSLAHSSKNLLINEPCPQDRSTKGNSSGICQSAGVSQNKVESAPFVESAAPKVSTQDQEPDSTENIAQMLENFCVQRLLLNIDFIRQLIVEHPDLQQPIQQNPEISELLDNSEMLWQTLELARHFSVIQEIMQIHQPQNLENPLNPQPYIGLEKIPNGNNALGQSYDGFSDQMFNSMQDLWGGNPFTDFLVGQVLEQVQPSPQSPSSSQEQWDQLPTAQVIYSSSCGLSSITSNNTTPQKVKHTSRENAAPVSTKGKIHVCAVQEPARIPALTSIEVSQKLQEDNSTTVSLGSSDQRLEEDRQQLDEQISSQITGDMIQLLRNHPNIAAQILLLMSMPQLNDQGRHIFLQPSQLSDVLLALANPKASQAILQIEHGLQLLATEAPVLLPCIEYYLWSLGSLPAPSCSYPDTMPRTWNVPDTTEPHLSECNPKSGTVLQRLQTLSGDTSHPLPAPEVRFRKQMESLQTMGFVNDHTNLQALIATDGDTNAAVHKLKRSQGF